MSMENIDLEALHRDLQEFAREQSQRSWWSRNWYWFVPTLLLALMVLCCGCFTAIFGLAVSQLRLDPYPLALKMVQEDPRVIERLGEPIEDVTWLPSGERMVDGEGGEARLDFDVAGPKGRAHVHFQARCIAGKWGFSQLEVAFGPNDKINLRADGDNEAPLFEGAKPATKADADAPPPEINLPMPPADGPG